MKLNLFFDMEGLHLNYMELSTIASALLYKSAVMDVSSEWYKHVYDKVEYFMKNSDSDNFYLQEFLF